MAVERNLHLSLIVALSAILLCRAAEVSDTEYSDWRREGRVHYAATVKLAFTLTRSARLHVLIEPCRQLAMTFNSNTHYESILSVLHR